jgi:hypothetical protein
VVNLVEKIGKKVVKFSNVKNNLSSFRIKMSSSINCDDILYVYIL